jgi:hypothetical protein
LNRASNGSGHSSNASPATTASTNDRRGETGLPGWVIRILEARAKRGFGNSKTIYGVSELYARMELGGQKTEKGYPSAILFDRLPTLSS